MKKISIVSIIAVVAFLITSCATQKEILYLQNINEVDLHELPNDYEAVIKKDDRLTILVSGPDKQVTQPYNLTLGDNPTSSMSNPENSTLSYLVDKEGNIDFPILGKIHVEGMSRNELMTYLKEEIGKDVKDPIVYVSIRNYKITVLGEVRSPGTYTMDCEKVNLLQALGRAGDLALTAERTGITLLREENGVMKHHVFDLRDAKLLEDPYFYLQQNDVIYVPASARRVATATASTSLWSFGFSTIGTITSAVTLVVTVTKLAKNGL